MRFTRQFRARNWWPSADGLVGVRLRNVVWVGEKESRDLFICGAPNIHRTVSAVTWLTQSTCPGVTATFTLAPPLRNSINKASPFKTTETRGSGSLCHLVASPGARINLADVPVTWSADVVVNDEFLVGLSLNGGPCTAFGSREIPWLAVFKGSGALNQTHQWVVFRSDGLVMGTNTFALCGGGVNSTSDTISFGLSTLAVQISQ